MLKDFFVKKETTPIVDVIDAIVDEMRYAGPSDENYDLMLTRLERLKALEEKSNQEPVSRDALFAVVGNIAGVLIIVAYEQKHVITTKALGFITKLK